MNYPVLNGPVPYSGGIEIKFDAQVQIERDTAQLAEIEDRIDGIYKEVQVLMGCLPRLDRCRDGLTRRIEANLESLALAAVVEIPAPEPVIAEIREPEHVVSEAPSDRPALQIAI